MSRYFCRILAYVRHHMVADYLQFGWMVVGDLGPTHGEHSVLMGWVCPPGCEPRMPPRR